MLRGGGGVDHLFLPDIFNKRSFVRLDDDALDGWLPCIIFIRNEFCVIFNFS